MNVVELISDLAAREITLWLEADGTQLRYRAPKGALTPALTERLKASKPEVMAWLREKEAVAGGLQRRYPASHGQRGLWLEWQLDPRRTDAHVVVRARLRDGVSLEALRRAAQSLIDQHPMLRSTYAVEDAQGEERLMQQVNDARAIDCTIVDGTAWTPSEVDRWIGSFIEQPFDLSTGAVTRMAILQSSGAMGGLRQDLIWTTHHIATDHFSQEILLRQLIDHYQPEKPQGAIAEPSPGGQLTYHDFVRWEQDVLRAESERLEQFWRSYLGERVPLLDWPAPPGRRRPRGDGASAQSDLVFFDIDSTLVGPLRALARANETTLYTVLSAAYAILLGKYTRQQAFLLLTPTSMRVLPGWEETVGYLVNLLILRVELPAGVTFAALVQQVHRSYQQALEHQLYPYALMLRHLHQQVSVEQLSQLAGFVFISRRRQAQGGALFEEITNEQRGTAQDLTLTILEDTDTLTGRLTYPTHLFDRDAVEHMAGHLQMLLRSVVSAPERPIDQLELLPPRELHRILVEWNDTTTAYPRETSLHRLFEAQVARTPDAVALVLERGEASGVETVTYSDLNTRANRLARRLQSLGVGPEALVGLCGDRSIETVVGLLGTLKAGGAYLPLDVDLPRERLAFMLADAKPRVVLTQGDLVDRIPLGDAINVSLDTEGDHGNELDGTNLPIDVPGDGLAYVMYTSGSTGQPKGVEVAHRSVVRLFRGARYIEFTSADTFLQNMTVSFDGSNFELWGTLLHGGRMIVPRPGVLSPQELGRLVDAHQVSVLVLSTGFFHVVVDDDLAGLRSLRLMLVGGDVVSPSHARRAAQLLPSCQILNCYGPTENTTTTACFSVTSDSQLDHSVPIGRPLANTRVYILDPSMKPVPVGVPGELYTGGDGLARGYLNRPALTAERFVPHPFPSADDSGRLYRTGDLARWLPDGNIEFLGRVDTQLKIRGFRIEPGEIETALGRHPGVTDCVVVASIVGDGEKRLVAYVVTEEELSTAALRSHLEQEMPEYMVPTAFVRLSVLPLTPNGKVDRKGLAARSFESVVAPLSSSAEPPRTPIERMLGEIWCELLGVREVGIHDHFFRLGGHSLLAVRALSRLKARAGVELPLRAIFQAPTIATLAAVVEQAQVGNPGPEAPAIVPVSREQPLPLSHAQERLWFLERMGSRPGVYNIPVALRLRGALDIAALERSFEELVRRHEILRTTFTSVDGQPTQSIHDPGFTLARLDRRGLPASDQEAELHRLVGAEAEHAFDLERGPLFRATLVWLAGEATGSSTNYLLLLALHHIIADGWSMGVVARELAALYGAYTQGATSPLAEVPVQYADYAVWQRAWLGGGAMSEQMAYWEQALDGAPSLLRLPTDHARPPVQSHAGAHLLFTLPAELHQRLRDLSAAGGASLFMTLLGAFQVLLTRYSGQQDIVVGTPVANRDRQQVESLVGFLVNMLPLRCIIEGDSSFEALLARTRTTVLEAYRHQDVPFEKIVEHLQVERDTSRSPLFQVVFDMPDGAPFGLDLELPGVVAEGLEGLPCTISKFDLMLSIMADSGHGSAGVGALRGRIEYNTDLFEAATIERMAGHLETLLEGIARDPASSIATLPLLTPGEHQKLLVEWNDTVTDYPQDESIHHLFEAEAARRPDAVALVLDSPEGHRTGGATVTYGELNARANRLAHHLRSLGVGEETLVGLFVERSIEMVVGILGILKAGGAYLPLDPSYPRERLDFMLADARPAVILAQRHLVDRIQSTETTIVPIDEGAPRSHHGPSEDLSHRVAADHLAYVMYTSGSLGQPKGTAVVHRNVVRLVKENKFARFTPEDIFVQSSPTSFDAATLELWGSLLNGGRLVLPPPRSLGLDELSRIIEEHRVTALWLTAGLFHLMVDEHLPALRPLRWLLAGGDVLSPAHVRRAAESLPSCRVINGYGPTENTTFTCCYLATAMSRLEPSVPIGRPIGNTQVYILDAARQPVPVGVAGELYAGGDGVARGYLGRPALTAEKFVSISLPSFSEPRRLYRTGDIARWLPDGNIEFLGRVDGQVKIRGFRIEPGEVEVALSRHPDVQEAVVMARAGDDGHSRLVAYVVCRGAFDPLLLRAHLERLLPDYMIPSAFVSLTALPLTANGKIDRDALPSPSWVQARSTYIAPRSQLEQRIAAVWRALLAVDEVGIHDNFFELGGNSLLLIQLHSQLQSRHGFSLAITDLFRYPTVAALAAHLDGSAAIAEQPASIQPDDRAELRRTRTAMLQERRKRASRSEG